jgi:hypothetical protein
MTDLNPPKVPKPDDLRTRIAEVVRAHPQGQEWGIPEEECTNCPRFFDGDWAAHVADAVIRELGLDECDNHDCRCRHEYVTDRKADDD